MIDVTDYTTTNPYVQIKYKPNHVGVLDEVKIFINRLTNKSLYTGGNLIL